MYGVWLAVSVLEVLWFVRICLHLQILHFDHFFNSFKTTLSVHTCLCGLHIFKNVLFMTSQNTILLGSVLYR